MTEPKPYIMYTEEKIKEVTEALFKGLDEDPDVLFLFRLIKNCFGREINVDDLYQLTKRNEGFAATWKQIKEELECRLAEKGLDRTNDSGMTKFTLSANYAWTEKKEVTNIDVIEAMPEFGD